MQHCLGVDSKTESGKEGKNFVNRANTDYCEEFKW